MQKHSKFIERFWARNDIKNYSRLQKPANIPSTSDIQLQSLDAQSLLVTARDRNTTFRPDMYTGLTSSPASSSLDLEWEHEYEGQTQSWYKFLHCKKTLNFIKISIKKIG